MSLSSPPLPPPVCFHQKWRGSLKAHVWQMWALVNSTSDTVLCTILGGSQEGCYGLNTDATTRSQGLIVGLLGRKQLDSQCEPGSRAGVTGFIPCFVWHNAECAWAHFRYAWHRPRGLRLNGKKGKRPVLAALCLPCLGLFLLCQALLPCRPACSQLSLG